MLKTRPHEAVGSRFLTADHSSTHDSSHTVLDRSFVVSFRSALRHPSPLASGEEEGNYSPLISICFGVAFSGNGIANFSTPFFSSASTVASFTTPGSAMRRLTEPHDRSRR